MLPQESWGKTPNMYRGVTRPSWFFFWEVACQTKEWASNHLVWQCEHPLIIRCDIIIIMHQVCVLSQPATILGIIHHHPHPYLEGEYPHVLLRPVSFLPPPSPPPVPSVRSHTPSSDIACIANKSGSGTGRPSSELGATPTCHAPHAP